jgi:K+-sensing histidine kinase KdpD
MPHRPLPRQQPTGQDDQELLNILAHELRRPLTALLGALATLQHRQQTLSMLQQQELLGIARRQGEQLGRFLEQILTAASLDRRHARLARRSLVDGAVLATEAGAAARAYAGFAADIDNRTHTVPDFADAVRRHQLIAAIERSAATGERVKA